MQIPRRLSARPRRAITTPFHFRRPLPARLPREQFTPRLFLNLPLGVMSVCCIPCVDRGDHGLGGTLRPPASAAFGDAPLVLRESVGARIALPAGLTDETGAGLRGGTAFGGGDLGALPA